MYNDKPNDHQKIKKWNHKTENETGKENEKDIETDTGINCNKQKEEHLKNQDCESLPENTSLLAHNKDNLRKIENGENVSAHFNDDENHKKVASLQNILPDDDVLDDNKENDKEILNNQNVLTNADGRHGDKVNHREMTGIQNILENADHSIEHDDDEIHILPDGSAWKQVYFICQIKQEVVGEGDESALSVKSSRQEVEITHILDRNQFNKRIPKSNDGIKKSENLVEQFEFSEKVGQDTIDDDISLKSKREDELDIISNQSTIMDDDVNGDQTGQFDDNFEKVLQEDDKQDRNTVVENFVKLLDQFEPDYETVRNQKMINTVEKTKSLSSENRVLDHLPEKSNIFLKENSGKDTDDSGKDVHNPETQCNGDPRISRDFRVGKDTKHHISETKSCFVLLEDFEKNENCSKEKCVYKQAFFKRKSLRKTFTRENSKVEESEDGPKLRLKNKETKEESYQCMFCQKRFMSKKGLKQHSLSHVGDITEQIIYRCQICDKEFKSRKGILYHMKHVKCYISSVTMETHEGQDGLQCRICFRFYSRKEHLRRHQRTIHRLSETVKSELSKTFKAKSRNLFKVKTSNRRLREKSNSTSKINLLKTAVKNLTTKSKNVTMATESKFKTAGSSVKRTGVENPVLVLGFRDYRCQVCKKPYHNFGLLKIHLKRLHSSCLSQKWLDYLEASSKVARKRKKITASTSGTQNVADKKGKDSTLSGKLKRPEKVKGKIRRDKIESLQYKCQLCSKEFRNIIQMNFHTKQKHSGVKTLPAQTDKNRNKTLKTKYFECNMCGKLYRSRSGLSKHKRQKGNHGNSVKCPDCGKKFPSELHLKYHSNIHKNDKVYGIKKKDIKMKLSKSSNVGNVGTENKSSNRCTVCQKAFPFTHLLHSHMVIKHTHLSKRRCKVCNNEFKNRQTLMNHIFVHMEKKLACQVCGRKYSHINRLRPHVKESHPGVHYKCEDCGELYYVPADLKKHKKLYHT